MKFSLNWLRDYVDIDLDAATLADRLSMAGLEVESIEMVGGDLCHIISAKIQTIRPHPQADRLVITELFDGTKNHQIVTGATNISEGDIVPVSLPGAVLASGTKIKKSKLRGVESNGMLCSQAELGLSEESEGIWILDPSTPLGVDMIEHAQLKDTLLDIAILPNRGDCQSVIGLAREISILLNQPLRLPNNDVPISSDAPSASLSVQVDCPEHCPLYIGQPLSGLKNGTTPDWMQRRLSLSGIRPISLFVDITNYVLLEYGQPLHAFDRAKLKGETLSVRLADDGETLCTLDEVKRTLRPSDLVISHIDQDTPCAVAIAGVMGDYNTQVDETSRDLFLEGAFFHPSSVRKTASRLALRTESSIRFEKTVDIEGIRTAVRRAAYFYVTLAGATAHEPVIQEHETSPRSQPTQIPFSTDQVNTLLGSSFSDDEIKTVLDRAGFSLESNSRLAHVPSWRRHDVTELPCLAEEVARLIGLDQIKPVLPKGLPLQEPEPRWRTLEQRCRQFLVHNGFSETNTFPMISEQDFKHSKLSTTHCIQLQNPISSDASLMRTQLLPSLLKVVSFNEHRQQTELTLFEIGKRFQTTLPKNQEETQLILLCSKHPERPLEKQADSPLPLASLRLKGLFETLIQTCDPHLTFDTIPDNHHPFLHPHEQLLFKHPSGVDLGYLGAVHPEVLFDYAIKQPLLVAVLNLSVIEDLLSESSLGIYQPISKFPSTRRDIAFLLKKDVPYSQIRSIVTQFKPKLVQSFELFDYFESETIGTDYKSLALSFRYQAQKETLSDERVNTIHKKFCKLLESKLPIQIR